MPTELDKTRTVIEDYWYTGTQMDDVGSAWQNQSPNNRLYCPTEIIGETGLTEKAIESIKTYPFHIMLPLNKGGNHWTSIGLIITQKENNTLHVKLGFSDSLQKNTDLPKLELTRIQSMFPSETIFDNQYYQHTWTQSDGSSCGPYALENASRFLEGKAFEDNPGRVKIREKQLTMMSNSSAITGCSKLQLLDDMILSWINEVMNQTTTTKSEKTYPLNLVAEMVKYYAEKNKLVEDELAYIIGKELLMSLDDNEQQTKQTKKRTFIEGTVTKRINDLLKKVTQYIPKTQDINQIPPKTQDINQIPPSTFFQKNRTKLLIGGPVTTTGLTFGSTAILCGTIPGAVANITALLPFLLPLPIPIAAVAFAAILAVLALLTTTIISIAIASLNPPSPDSPGASPSP